MVVSKPAPIACTLSPAEFKHRAAWMARLTESALVAHRIHGGTHATPCSAIREPRHLICKISGNLNLFSRPVKPDNQA